MNEISELEKLDNLIIKTRTSLAAFHSYNYLLAKENISDHLPLDKKNSEITLILLIVDSLRWYYPDQVKGFVLSNFVWIKVAPLTSKFTNIVFLKKIGLCI